MFHKAKNDAQAIAISNITTVDKLKFLRHFLKSMTIPTTRTTTTRGLNIKRGEALFVILVKLEFTAK